MCNTCIHKIVCSKYIACGEVKTCEHFKEERRGNCLWCNTGNELCGTCAKFFDYFGDGYDKCSASCEEEKCAYYEPIGFCPRCGADMRGKEDGECMR